jgi:hypothetical protein
LQDAVKDSGFSSLHSSDSSGKGTWLLISLAMLLFAALVYGLYLNNLNFFQGLIAKVSSAPAVKQYIHPQAELEVVQEVEKTALNEKNDSGAEPALQTDELEQTQPAQKIELQAEQNERIKRVLESVSELEAEPELSEMESGSKKVQQTDAKLDKVTQNQAVEFSSSNKEPDIYEQWLIKKIEDSKQWLMQADKQGVSIQVMMRNRSAAKELATYLQTEWPLDLEKTYLYEVKMKNKQIFRVFYDEFPTITLGQMRIKQLPESVRINSPYLHSIYRMQKALL